MIFHSGVSTAKSLSNISGRGVGMDAVRNFLKKKGGDIHVELHPSKNEDYVPFNLCIKIPSRFAVQTPA